MYEAQLRSEARYIGTGLRLAPDLGGMMYVEFGYVEGPSPSIERMGPLKYPSEIARVLVCLHELGHAYYGHTQGRPPYENEIYYFTNGVLRSEAQAWEYALEQANAWELPITDVEREFMWDCCLGSYYRSAVASNFQGGQRLQNGDRGYHAFAFDRPTTYFWNIVEAIKPGVREAYESETPVLASQPV